MPPDVLAETPKVNMFNSLITPVSSSDNSLFSSLPYDLQPEDLPDVFQQLTWAINQIDEETDEAKLRSFVQWALRQSYSPALSPLDHMKILDLAWQVQKYLWSHGL
ncbi:MAG: hypothetical protein Kow00121_45850 [Elainellaceae cyanobacterium]